MMSRYCPNCGTEVDETAVFCPTCGQPIDEAMETEIPAAPAWPEPQAPVAPAEAPTRAIPPVEPEPPAGSATGDQKRVTTPAQAIAAGADYLVVGRPIVEAADPKAVADAIAADIASAAANR